ncbi:MAG TPA: hypothetical protein VK776_19085 [Bryobacteraceae bacterium]|jgi:hypothetical protein|nr:hypothetical protein [Bryobacteraceae bacterium]
MQSTGFTKTRTHAAAAGLALLTGLLVCSVPGLAQNGRNGQIHIVKDCSVFSGIPGSSYCKVISSNLVELPAGTLIYYDQITAGPSAGAGYLDSNVFVYVKPGQWAVGRCTVPNDNTPGLCTLSDGFGVLSGFSARITVTYAGGPLYAWDGTYSFQSLPDR